MASFAPPRRARLAGNQIAAVLATDDAFRDHVAAQVRASHEELARALEGGVAPRAADPVELAATAYLLRSAGWADLVAAAMETAEAEQASFEGKRAGEQLSRLERQLADATGELDADPYAAP